MAKLVYALNQSLDGYVDHDHEKFVPRPALFRHFIEDVRGLSGMVYGRRMYQIMRYWGEDHANWAPGNMNTRLHGAVNQSGLCRAR